MSSRRRSYVTRLASQRCFSTRNRKRTPRNSPVVQLSEQMPVTMQRWPVEKKRAVDSAVDRRLEIGIVEDNHRVLASQGLCNAAARGHRADEGNGRDVLVFEQSLANGRSATHHEIEHARRDTALTTMSAKG
jgi:hypothetical protein